MKLSLQPIVASARQIAYADDMTRQFMSTDELLTVEPSFACCAIPASDDLSLVTVLARWNAGPLD